ncbi:MAG: ribose transport system permease protein [Thermotogaceae bacterium]|jgi:ribose transport system permease protein|uniref:ABC transporter permease n=1 Tax=Thermotoga petrophila TaxID=93929 RepID=UPI0026543E0B|nr:ribose transport system permease protein [Thermotogaceae bacterium]
MLNMKALQREASRSVSWKDFFRKYGVVFGLIGVMIFFSIAEPEYFPTFSNFMTISKQAAVNILLALGEMCVILTAGIDLSVSSVAGLAGAIFAGSTLAFNSNVWAGAFMAILTGIAFGFFNGSLVAFGKLPPFIATLASMSIGRGLLLIYTNGQPIWGLPNAFYFLGQGNIGNIPVPFIVIIISTVVMWFLLSRTSFGRSVYSVGGNIKAAFASGINVKGILMSVYAISGFFAAFGGMLLTSRLGSAQPNAALGYELDAIAAVVVGGTSLFGGEGWVIGTFLGGYLIATLNNGMAIMNISPYIQQLVKGFVIILAVLPATINKKFWNE